MPDDWLLEEAHKAGWTLVTYDMATIPPILQRWAIEGMHHAGVIFLDDRRFPQTDLGCVLKALVHAWDTHRNMEGTNRIIYLDRAA